MHGEGARYALTVSGTVPGDVREQVATQRRPLPDYVALVDELDARMYDHVDARSSRIGRVVARLLGSNAALALHSFLRRRDYDVVVTDGEQIGLPLALLLRLVPTVRRPRHVMIVHTMSPLAKRLLFKAFRLDARIDRYLVYASSQASLLCVRLRVPAEKVERIPFMVDTEFFAPTRTPRDESRRFLVATAGLELRDYATLVEAAAPLDADVIIAAASPWSRRSNPLDGAQLPANVHQRPYGIVELRELYDRADIVVVPLLESEFQAGITTILEAMSMAKPIVCSRTTGQQDTLVDGRTGIYAPTADPGAMREAIRRLMQDDALCDGLGASAREWVEANADVRVYARRIAGTARSVLDEARRSIV